MFLDIGVKDLINVNAQKVTYNEVILTRNDVIKMQKLMQYFTDHLIHFEDSIRLDSLIPTQQNEIGLIFFEYYEYTIVKEGAVYLNKNKFVDMFQDSETIMQIIDRVEKVAPSTVENTLIIEAFSTTQLNTLIINWFHNNYRNFRSIEKNILFTTNLFDINLNAGYFNKMMDVSEFLGTMFTRFVRIKRGSIPFSGNFGSTIKQSIQTKSNYFTKKHILEEIVSFTKALTNIYDDDFHLVDIDYRETIGLTTSIRIFVTIEINKDKEVKFVLQ